MAESPPEFDLLNFAGGTSVAAKGQRQKGTILDRL